ncbi:MAG: phage terminase large subunit [Alphaproteobacteria bacterium]
MPVDLLSRRALDETARYDFATFVQRVFQTVSPKDAYLFNWHIDLVADALTRCAAGDCNRLIITMPPRYLKSIITSVAFPAWLLGHNPALRFICASYSIDLAAKHARDCRSVMESGWYKRVFPGARLSQKRSAELDFTTTRQGYRYTTSVNGTLTGRGANVIIIDDPLKADDAQSEAQRSAVNQWFSGTVYSRLDDKANDVIIVVTQRLHMNDLVGHLLESDEDWEHISLPAIAEVDENFVLSDGRTLGRYAGEVLHEDRESRDTLDRIRRSLGSYNFSAQYQQNPLPIEGNMIRWAWFRSYDQAPERVAGDVVIQSWDTASKASEFNDWSVCTTWLLRDGKHYLLHVWRGRVEYPYLLKKISELKATFTADTVFIEDKGSGTQLIQDLRNSNTMRVIAINPQADKVTRMAGQSLKIENGDVYLPKDAPWLDTFRTEVLQFPDGRFDDQVDSLSQYLGNVVKAQPVDMSGSYVLRESVMGRYYDPHWRDEMEFFLHRDPVRDVY